MTSQTEKAKAKLAALSTSLDDLEAYLQPLFAHSLPETLLGLEPIQQAKLQTVLPYLVYDLVFIYLKSRGIDPKTHPVVPELDRVKQYFDKITAAENPPQKRAEIDKAAAGRFIKHAITQAAHAKPPMDDSAQPTISEPSTSSLIQIPAKVTSKMLQRQQYEKELKEQDDAESEEEELAVFGDDDMEMDTNSSALNGGKGKELLEPNPQSISRRKRPVIDPFAGYGDDLPTAPTKEYRLENLKSSKTLSPRSSSVPLEETKIQRGKKRARDAVDSPSDTPKSGGLANLPASNEGNSVQDSPTPVTADAKKAKKAKKKKARKSLTTST